jgi:hypothetical protein
MGRWGPEVCLDAVDQQRVMQWSGKASKRAGVNDQRGRMTMNANKMEKSTVENKDMSRRNRRSLRMR